MMLCANAQSITWGYYNGSQKTGAWGTQKAETYSVDMKVNQPSLAGSMISSVNIPFNIEADGVSDCEIYFSKDIPSVTSGKAKGDIVNIPFTAADGWNTVELAEPLAFPEGDFYVGVTFKATAKEFNPMILMVDIVEDGFNVITSRTYRKRTDLGSSLGASLPIQLVVNGEVLKAEAVQPYYISDAKVKKGEQKPTSVVLANHGTVAVKNIDWEYEIAGKKYGGHDNVDIANDAYGAQATFHFDIPALDENGVFEGTFTVLNVNGNENADNVKSYTHKVSVVNVVPTKRPLMEEYTGAWCGFCPSGFVAMKLMNERHPDEFICASYHNGDAMQITTRYPVTVDGFPDAWFDRNHQTEAYRGDARKDMGIEITWAEECEEDTPLNVAVTATVDAETGELVADASFEMCDNLTDEDLVIGYIVTADGLSGSGPNWRQHNYFSMDYQNGTYSNMYIEGMEGFNNGAEYQYLTYDDVVVSFTGSYIEGVIPAAFSEGDVFVHQNVFNTNDMNANYGANENLVQDINRLHVIALVYDNKTKHVVNCAKCDVKVSDSSAIDMIHNESKATEAFNLAGQRVDVKSSGIYIIRSANGKANKVVVR